MRRHVAAEAGEPQENHVVAGERARLVKAADLRLAGVGDAEGLRAEDGLRARVVR